MKLIVKVENENDLKLFKTLFKNYVPMAEVVIDKKPVEVSKGCYKMEDTVTIIDTYSFDIQNDKLVFASLLLKHLDKHGIDYLYKLED